MNIKKPTKQEAEDAIRVLLNYVGEDIQREGMLKTPARVVRSYDELLAGYKMDISEILSTTFSDISSFDDVILLKKINFTSLCEHHMLPFSGFADIAYLPNGAVIGISKIARLVDAFSKRLQIQEKMTAEIAIALEEYLRPRGVAVRISASHSCMTVRGARKGGSIFDSYHFTGVFKEQLEYRQEFWSMIK